MNKDSTEDPYDVAFSTDGLQVFTVNHFQESVRGKGNLSMNRLMEPFDVSRTKRRILGDVDCNNIDLDELSKMALKDPSTSGNPKKLSLEDIKKLYEFSIEGKTFE